MTKSSVSKKSLVIVESPAKAKTINRYLGPDFVVQASMGHVRDLPSKGLNVDIENDFEPTYDILPGKKRTVTSLKAAAKKCDKLYLATDLDREGEAIAWHLAQILGIPEDKTYRVIFNAITKTTIQRAFAEPGKLNMDKVMAQQARRILDRIVGYQISPLLWKKVTRGLSAGRVQSVAVKIVVLKEREIQQFKPDEYWLIPAVFTTDLKSNYTQEWLDFITPKTEDDIPPTIAKQNKWLTKHNALKAEMYKVDGEKFDASNQEQASRIFEAMKDADFKVADIEKKESLSRPSAPFITSTLQQAAANRLGFTAKKTMAMAQQLYEGIDLGSMGSLGLITYMRTDSTHLSDEAIKEVRNYISMHLGQDYLPAKPKVYESKKAAQQAHEAIRPTDVDLTPNDIKPFLSDQQFKLYDLIWRRFVASQMEPAKWNITNLNITADTSVGECRYKSAGRVLVFDGFTKIWTTTSNDQQLPSIEVGQQLQTVDIKAEQHFTKPPARYTEASLVKALEKEGVGRPSTYATIISTIQDRGYVEKQDKRFFATDIGEVVTDKLSEYFPKIMDIAFTRYMEEQLDKIEEHNADWLGVLKDFYSPFKQNLETAQAEMKHAKAEMTPSEYKCPDCGQLLSYRFGKNGKFLSCSTYPECKFACPCDKEGKMLEEKVSDHKCPQCSKPMIQKNGRFGPFIGCSGYPECKTTLKIDKEGNVLPPKPPPEPTGIKCYKCKDGELVIRQSKKGPFMGCGKFPKCRTIISIKQLDHLKELQAAGQWPPETWEEADEILGRKKARERIKVKK
ncbi:MAG: type I DNA topoisomerase [Planctomycetes bacterium]|nr:type I DNA topoisomerase [Planctomycetota bacterium]MBL7145739.1 type I DNA topoisomerase [Phycisphaerae bacterium]